MTWNIDINRNRCFFIIHTRIFLMKYIWRKNRSNISMEEKAYRFANVRKKTQWLFQNRDFKAELYRRFLLDHYSIHCSTDNIESTIGQSRAQQITAEIEKIKEEFEKNENQLKIDSENFKEEKQIDVFRLNIDEEISMTTREKPYSNLKIFFFSIAFNGRWKHKFPGDRKGNIFSDINPILFRYFDSRVSSFVDWLTTYGIT